MEAIREAESAKLAQKGKEDEEQQSSFPLIAKLRGHKNDYSPSITYIPQSNCLVSAEKNVRRGNKVPGGGSGYDPTVPSESGYGQYTKRHDQANMKCEVLIWNLQKDLIELFSSNYPWNV